MSGVETGLSGTSLPSYEGQIHNTSVDYVILMKRRDFSSTDCTNFNEISHSDCIINCLKCIS